MTVERTLAKVDDDLRRGDLTMARTRLKSLTHSLPHRLDARERLADVYRLEGNTVEAGRWSYLAEQRDPAEVAAFERACGQKPVRIMRALLWRGSEDAAATEIARDRLRDVRARAEADTGRRLDWSDPGRGAEGPWWEDAAGLIGCMVVGLVLAVLVVVGAATVVGWIF
ncbi:DUF6584 family protein [Cellulomonas shaoxiangyii]|uniref:Uncharacterized protein n=1 Tax=Cellulomonas shaoxiangyii TaxID=2566013 RepID=A0A4P7SPN2_9CELL|nr:DUF6584 family protein [Cellulomonas shaoxiangyii]QCB94954.1 hypothetical protein E5225_16675 [Cellulomonas shaoxiangyii]TGY82038.1 hypothetical protein E5226_13560 [Cellulomonas shaoxiangyii]